MLKKICIGSDHAGVELKAFLMRQLEKHYPQVQLIDAGTHGSESVDYPDFADVVVAGIHSLDLVKSSGSLLNEAGILICGSGQGMVMRANRFQHIRAALCWNPEVARLAREHNNSNVVCLGARFVSEELAWEIVRNFLETPFVGGRHLKRVEKLSCPTQIPI